MIFIILLLIITIVIIYLYYENKLANAKKRILSTSNQLYNIRAKYKNAFLSFENVNIRFLTPNIKIAIANNNTNMFLAPMTNSPKLKILDTKMEVTILDSAIIDNILWYYVNLPTDSQYNCRGWIRESDFIPIHNTIKEIQ